ncbi:hypothetical protein OAF26_02910 [Akkermansiaceae bacterium]|nr:hypothetical protein [Akkermansiaceae bacterium]|tara:strand:+ start:3634 stop:4395 length:762 start_codon:yes stop_codon:yes gene_type:complete
MHQFFLLITLVATLPGLAAEKKSTPLNLKQVSIAKKILFVGNSFTYWNKGLWYHMEQLVQCRPQKLNFKAEHVVRGGASLKVMWGKTKASSMISQGHYDVVVLQEDLPETDVKSFYKFARKFNSSVRKSEARPVFFMAWPYKRLGWIGLKEIAKAHRAIGAELGAQIAPVGIAWEKAMKERPEVDMYAEDKEHPSIQGTYLALCVLYSTIYGESSTMLEYLPKKHGNMTAREAAWLRRVAWATVQAEQAFLSK